MEGAGEDVAAGRVDCDRTDAFKALFFAFVVFDRKRVLHGACGGVELEDSRRFSRFRAAGENVAGGGARAGRESAPARVESPNDGEVGDVVGVGDRVGGGVVLVDGDVPRGAERVFADVEVAGLVDGDGADVVRGVGAEELRRSFGIRPFLEAVQLTEVFTAWSEGVEDVRSPPGDVDVAVGGTARFVDRDVLVAFEVVLGRLVFTGALAVDRV